MNQTRAAALQEAYEHIKAGQKHKARAILLPMLRENQNIADAWYLLAHAVSDPRRKLIAFQEVLRLEPANQAAKRQVAGLLAAQAAEKKRKVGEKRVKIFAAGLIGLMSTSTFLMCLMLVGMGLWLSQGDSHQVAAAPISATVFKSPTAPPTSEPTSTPSPTETNTSFPTETLIIIQPAQIQDAPATPIPATSVPSATAPNPTPDSRLTAKNWRDWPAVPTLSAKSISILQLATQNRHLDSHTFSRVGDCQLTTGTFLGGYGNGKYPIPDGLAPTVEYFHQSIITESITASNGLGVNSVLNPIFGAGAGHSECGANETPLACELRIRRPAVVVVGMGTNWVPHAEISFEKYLRQVVDRILATGALPILATKADNIETDWKLNQAIAQVAYDYDLPLVNVWRSVQDLPNHGLEAPQNIYLTGDGWMRRNRIWLQTLDLTRLSLSGE